MDFTIELYYKILNSLKYQGFSFLPFNKFISSTDEKRIVLRHDVDKLPGNSLISARIESEIGIRGTYYFRIVPPSFNEKMIKEIYSLGHEIGYHYEDLGTTAQRYKALTTEEKLVEIAIKSFDKNLAKLKELVPVTTICPHGSPMSKWDSRLLWKYYDYHDFEIIGDPYFDIDFNEVLYLTDTGRRWNGKSVSVRDKVGDSPRNISILDPIKEWKVKALTGSLMNMIQSSYEFQNKYCFHSTSDIIKTASLGELPNKIMMTFHPQRWTDSTLPWFRELVFQNIKNIVKYILINMKSA